MLFQDRHDAGQQLAESLRQYKCQHDVIVLALPRGGVPVATEVAKAIASPLDIFIVRKLGAPTNEELAIGAIASGGLVVLNEQLIDEMNISKLVVDQIIRKKMKELVRKESAYRNDKRPLRLQDMQVILVDDGLATGASMRAAAIAVRQFHPKRIVVAVPVAARTTCEDFKLEVDETVCLRTPEPFGSVSAWYKDFTQVTDEEVKSLLDKAGTIEKAA